MSRILITGANGFLGGKLIRYILENTDFEVIVIASSEGKIRQMIEREVITEIERISFLSNKALVAADTELPEIYGAIHLAFARRNRPVEDIASSIDFSEKVFQKLFASSAKRIINVSSQGVYGNTELFRCEDMPAAPMTPYTMAKYATEKIFEAYAAMSEEKEYTSLRLDCVAQSQNVFTSLCKQALEGEITLRGGKQRFSFIDADDAAVAIIAMLTSADGWDKIYNVGWNRKRFTLLELADEIAGVAYCLDNIKPIISFKEEDIQLWTGMDSSKFMSHTGWKPQFALDEMIMKCLRQHLRREKTNLDY